MSAAGINAIDIPGYRILHPLGQGGMATVYLAVQENFGREVALKLISPRYRGDESFAARFMREAKIVAQMRHSNIVSVYDVGNHQGQLYLSMELLEGDLKSRIGQGLNDTEAARICIAIASALGYAHQKGYLHRDIKPENVLFRSDGTPVLTDFGIARALESPEPMTQAGMLVGTPSYMSPEQARGEPVDQRTDIYALGVLFYELLTGAVPYKATSAVSTALKHISEPIPELPAPLKHWNPFLRTILAKDARERFQYCKDVISALAMTASITDIEDSDRTAIINAAEMATLLGKGHRRSLAAARDDPRPLRQFVTDEPSRHRTLLLPVLLLLTLLAGGAFALFHFDIIDAARLKEAAALIDRAQSQFAARTQSQITPALSDVDSRAAIPPVEQEPLTGAEPTENAITQTDVDEGLVADAQKPDDGDAAASQQHVAPEPADSSPAEARTAPGKAASVSAPAKAQQSKASIATRQSIQDEPEAEPQAVIKPYVPEYKPVVVAQRIENVGPAQFERFRHAFQNRDLQAMRAIAVISPANQRLAKTLFENYTDIHLQLSGMVTLPEFNEMRARLTIDRLKNLNGQTVEPGEHWKTLPLTARINANGNVLLFW